MCVTVFLSRLFLPLSAWGPAAVLTTATAARHGRVLEAGTEIGTDWPYLMVAGGSRGWPWWGVDEVITDWAPLPE